MRGSKAISGSIVQDVRLTTDTVCFRKEKWYSPSLRQTFLPSNSPGYDGQFGPGIKALVLTLAFENGMSEPIIRRLLTLAGVSISTGQLSNLVVCNHDAFHDDRTAILKAGLASSPWQHHPKGSRHDGHPRQWHQCPLSYAVQSALYRVYDLTAV